MYFVFANPESKKPVLRVVRLLLVELYLFI